MLLCYQLIIPQVALARLSCPPHMPTCVTVDGFHLVSKPWVWTVLHFMDTGENVLLSGSHFSSAVGQIRLKYQISFLSEAAIFIMCLKECSTLQYHKRHLSIQHCAILTRQIQKFYRKEAWTIFLLKPLTCAFHQYSKLSARVSIQFYMWWHHMVEIHGTCVVLMKKDYGLGSCELKVKKMHWDDRMLNVLHVKKIT